MFSRLLAGFMMLSTLILLAGCGRNNGSTMVVLPRSVPSTPSTPFSIPKTGSNGKPIPPLVLLPPPTPGSRLDGFDLTAMPGDELRARAQLASRDGKHKDAVAYQHWAVQKTKQGQYDLACYYGLSGGVSSALYWLQMAAAEEGVDLQHSLRDTDLVLVRIDPRWNKLVPYIEECNNYFERADLGKTLLAVPHGYKLGTPIPAVLWLHGMGSSPDGFMNGYAQEFADMLKVAIIGVRGTKARGATKYVWAEDPAEDAKRMRQAVKDVSDRVTVKKGFLITFGFSQGAQVGLDVAVRSPEEYAGSIVLSAGAESYLDKVKPSPLLARRGFVMSCGGEEHPGNVALTKDGAEWLKRANAKVILKLYPGVKAHSLPADFDERFPEWIKFILKTRGED